MSSPWGLAAGVAIVLGVWLGPMALPIAGLWMLGSVALRGRLAVSYTIVVALGVLAGVARGVGGDAADPPTSLAASSGAVVEVESLPRPSPAGSTVLVTVQALTLEGEDDIAVAPSSVLLRLPPGETAAPGDVLRVGWTVSTLASLPPGYAEYLAAQGAAASAHAWWSEPKARGPTVYQAIVTFRERITSGLREALPGDAGALAAGIVTGDDSALSDGARLAFLRTGATHITAVSGSNVAMVLALWNLVVPAGRLRRMLVVQILIAVTIWAYAFLVGLEPGVVRAALVASLGLFAVRAGRRPDLLTLLAIAAAVMVMWRPGYVSQVAFWLSMVASAAITSRVPARGDVAWPRVLRGTAEGVLVAQVATLPLVLAWFGTVSLSSILANLLLAPLMIVAFPLCFILAGVVTILPALAGALAIAPLVPLTVSLALVEALAHTLPPLELEGVGAAALIAVSLPCLALTLALSVDGARWGAIVARRWRREPVLVAMTLIGPLAGVLTAVLAVLVRG